VLLSEKASLSMNKRIRLLRASSIDVDARVTPLDPPANPKEAPPEQRVSAQPAISDCVALARHRQPSRLVANAIAAGETADLMKAIGACEVADRDAGAAGRVERFVRLPMPSSRSRPRLVHAVKGKRSGSSTCAWLASSSCRLVLYALRQRVR
jgi:hypothetical protein